ncbi:MAG: ATP-binding protein [Steroidobacteraceae bacterium]
MNTRSLSFRLIAWYAGLLTLVFLLLGAVMFAVVANDLQASLRNNQMRRAQQISDTLLEGISHSNEPALATSVETLYAPEANDRFIRISRGDGRVLFESRASRNPGLTSEIPPLRQMPASPSWREVRLPEGGSFVIGTVIHRSANGTRYLVEVGARTAPIDAALGRLLAALATGLPIAIAIAVIGGFLLVRRSLVPMERIARKAEVITQHNLSERLPVERTGDELERLSLSLNHMISRLEEAVQGSKRLVADASHELRTPLTVMRGELESMAADPQTSRGTREMLASLLEEVERLAAVVDGLLALSRLDTGEASAAWVKFDLAELVATTADQMSLLAEDRSITVACDAPQGVIVEGNRARLKQVVVNLLDNAIKYTQKGGTVRLKVALQNGSAVFEVADTGIGIPPEALPHVFERFFRVERSRSREQGGAGLGLSIVKSICAAHGAAVEVQSTPDQGSRFCIRFPLSVPEIEQSRLPEGAA